MGRTVPGATAGAAGSPAPLTIAYLLEIHPALSQTFLEREMAGVRAQGVEIRAYSLLRTRERLPPPAERPAVEYFPWWEVVRLITALPRELRRHPGLLRDAWGACRGTQPRSVENVLVNLWAVVFALCRAEAFRRSGVQLVHGAWATGPATAAALLGRLCGVPFSFAAHAYDIYENGGDQFLEPKLRAAAFVHTTTHANLDYLRQRAPQARLVLARRGLEELPSITARPRAPGPVRILSVGRLVPKKGHLHQLAAGAQLQQWGVPFELRIVGDGEMRRTLQERIHQLGLANSVTLCGGLPHDRVQELFPWSDVFWHTGIVDARGNRDGLPNVIPEAFSHGLPVICGSTPGATEAVLHEGTGLVVDVTDPAALAGAVKRLAEDEPLRRRLGAQGRHWVEQNFLVGTNTAVLAEAFREASASRESHPVAGELVTAGAQTGADHDCAL